MKKKIYLMAYSVIQFVMGIYYVICHKAIAASQLEAFEETFKMFGEDMQKLMGEAYSLETLQSGAVTSGIIGILLAIPLFILFLKGKDKDSKLWIVVLLVSSMLFFGDTLIMVLAGIAMYLVLKNKDKKNKNLVPKLDKIPVTAKDLILAVVFLLFYATQFLADYVIKTGLGAFIFMVVYYLGVAAFGIYVFRKRLKRDFKAYKYNFGKYLGTSFKYWLLMIGLSFVAATIRMALGGATETANQESLGTMPMWYVAPLAIVWAPLVEELVFRGVLRRFIKNDKVFIVISAISFGLLHTITIETGLVNILVQSLQYVAMGGAMAYAYTKTNNIGVNMSVHCIQNTFSTIMMMFM